MEWFTDSPTPEFHLEDPELCGNALSSSNPTNLPVLGELLIRPILSKGPRAVDELKEAREAGIEFKEIEVMLPVEKVMRRLITVRK